MKTLAFGCVALALPLAAAAQAENYVIDPYHTVPYFETDHLGFETMRGRFAESCDCLESRRGQHSCMSIRLVLVAVAQLKR